MIGIIFSPSTLSLSQSPSTFSLSVSQRHSHGRTTQSHHDNPMPLIFIKTSYAETLHSWSNSAWNSPMLVWPTLCCRSHTWLSMETHSSLSSHVGEETQPWNKPTPLPSCIADKTMKIPPHRSQQDENRSCMMLSHVHKETQGKTCKFGHMHRIPSIVYLIEISHIEPM